MTGSTVIDFIIGLIVLCAAVAMIYRAIPFVSPDATFSLIARWAVGVIAVIALLMAVKSILFGGGAAATGLTGLGLIYFAIGLILLLLVIYLIYMAIGIIVPAEWQAPVKYVVGGLALVVLLLLAAQVLFGANVVGGLNFGNQRRSEDLPFMHRQVMIPPPTVQIIR